MDGMITAFRRKTCWDACVVRSAARERWRNVYYWRYRCCKNIKKYPPKRKTGLLLGLAWSARTVTQFLFDPKEATFQQPIVSPASAKVGDQGPRQGYRTCE